MLKQITPLSEWLETAWVGFNWKATAFSDNLEDAQICAFYWKAPDNPRMQHYRSSGVLLRLVDPKERPFGNQDRHNRLARPVVAVPPAPQKEARYNVEFTVQIMGGNKQKMLSFHCPRFVETTFPKGIQDLEIDSRTHLGWPNIIRFRQSLDEICEPEAVAYCLCYAPFFRIKLDTEPEFRFLGERLPSKNYVDGVVAFDMRRA